MKLVLMEFNAAVLQFIGMPYCYKTNRIIIFKKKQKKQSHSNFRHLLIANTVWKFLALPLLSGLRCPPATSSPSPTQCLHQRWKAQSPRVAFVEQWMAYADVYSGLDWVQRGWSKLEFAAGGGGGNRPFIVWREITTVAKTSGVESVSAEGRAELKLERRFTGDALVAVGTRS